MPAASPLTDTPPPSPTQAPPAASPLQDQQAAADETRKIVTERAPVAQWQTNRKAIVGSMDAAQEIKPPNFPELKPLPPTQQTSPAQAWGSLAMLAAAIGGAMSRTHATTALNAAADALKSFHQGDQEHNQLAMERWKTANDNLLKQVNYELDTYKALMGAKGQSISTLLGLSAEDRLQASANALTHSRTIRDDATTQKLERGEFDKVVKDLEVREKVYLAFLDKSKRLTDEANAMRRLHTLRTTDEYKKATPLERYNMEYNLLGEIESYDATADVPDPAMGLDPSKWIAINKNTGKTVQYMGTGDSEDEKNWQEVPPGTTAPPATSWWQRWNPFGGSLGTPSAPVAPAAPVAPSAPAAMSPVQEMP